MVLEGWRIPWIPCAALLLSATAGEVSAMEAPDYLLYKVGPLHIAPEAGLSEQYNDNILYGGGRNGRRPRVGDFITTISPGINFELGKPDYNNVILQYRMDKGFYAKNDQQNFLNHQLLDQSHVTFSKITIEGKDQFDLRSDIVGGTSNIGERVDRNILRDQYRVTYDFTAKTDLYLQGDHMGVDYATGTPLYDHDMVQGTGGFGYRWTPKTRVFGEIYYGQAASGPNRPFNPNDLSTLKGPHADFIGGFVGVRGDFTSRISGQIKTGYESRTYSDGTSAPSEPVVDASVDYRMSDKTTFTLGYRRYNGTSEQFARETYTDNSLQFLVHQMLGNSGKYSVNLHVNADLYDFQPTVLGYQNGQRVTIDTSRFDQYYRAGIEFAYKPQLWLSASLAYDYERFSSSLNGIIDYDANRVTINVLIGY